jgi:hypothetical protein
MKFDKLVRNYITEVYKGQIAGHVGKLSRNIDPTTIVDEFINSRDPKFLYDAVVFANDRMNVPIKIGKKSFAGERFKEELKKEIFEVFTPTKQNQYAPATNKFVIPLEDVRDPSTGEVKTAIMGSNAPNFFKYFYKQNSNKKLNPAFRDVWFKLINALYPEYERQSDIRQEEDVEKVKVQYINAKGQKTDTELTVRKEDGTITGSPLGDMFRYDKPEIRPKSAKGDYKSFKRDVGGTLDGFLQVTGGKEIGRRVPERMPK